MPPRATVNCTWFGAYPDVKPSLASAVVVVPGGFSVGSSNLQPFNFLKAPNVTAGTCASISDVWTYTSSAKFTNGLSVREPRPPVLPRGPSAAFSGRLAPLPCELQPCVWPHPAPR